MDLVPKFPNSLAPLGQSDGTNIIVVQPPSLPQGPCLRTTDGAIARLYLVVQPILITGNTFLGTAANVFASVQVASGGGVAVQLPDAATAFNMTAVLKDALGVSASWPIELTSGGGLIDGQTTAWLATNFGSLSVISDGVRWSTF